MTRRPRLIAPVLQPLSLNATKPRRERRGFLLEAMLNRTAVVALLIALVFGRGIAADAEVDLRVAAGTTLTEDERASILREFATAREKPAWVDAERLRGHAVVLVAEGVFKPVALSETACRGSITHLMTRDDAPRWLVERVQYAVFDADGVDACAGSTERRRRIWLRGAITDDELLGILTAIHGESSGNEARLQPSERIILIEKKEKAFITDPLPIEVHTVSPTDDGKGRIFEFERGSDGWKGTLKGGWLS